MLKNMKLVGTNIIILVFVASCSGPDSNFSIIETDLLSLAISPVAATLAISNLKTFTATGGTEPYAFSIFSGSGSILSTTGSFTAAGVAGTAVVRVIDSVGRVADAIVTVNPSLELGPINLSLGINATAIFTATGGVAPISYSLVSGNGLVDSATGSYTAPSLASTDVLRATDALGNTSEVTVSIFSGLGISPSVVTLAVNNILGLSAAGGAAPYTFSMLSGSGVVTAAGNFTAAAVAGLATVRVTDSLGATADSTITINPELLISPLNVTVFVNSTSSFSETGGVGPYSYTVISGTGSINSSTGLYTAPALNGSTQVRVTDAIGNFSDSTITVTTPLTISPTMATLAVNNSMPFAAIGGTGPFVFSKPSGSGSINSSTGMYSGPAVPGVAVVRVTDSLGAFAQANININAGISISPATQTMGVNGTLNYSVTGGVAPYIFAVITGSGSVHSSSGIFTAAATAGSVLVRVTDALGNSDNSNLTVVSGLSISPAGVTLAVNNAASFAGASGAAPYIYSLVSGTGSINSSTGLYTAPASAGTAVVRVTDNVGATADASLTINAALAIVPTTKTLAVNNSFSFTTTGGVSPINYSMSSGSGSINVATGSFTAASSAGVATILATDGLGNTASAAVTVNGALSISPSVSLIAVTGMKTFSSAGGVSPYAYSIVSGPGAVHASSGVYTPATAGSVTVRTTDSMNNTSDSTLTVNAALAAQPNSINVIAGSSTLVAGVDGVPPYTYSVFAGMGSIDSVSGEYTSSLATGAVTIRVTDAALAVADVTLTVVNALSLTPLTLTVATNSSQTFTAAGGVGARSFSVSSGVGTINSTSGVYIAPSTIGTESILVTDANGNTVAATLKVVNQLSISPSVLKLPVFSTVTFSSILGTSPYNYSVSSGTGSVDMLSGLYTAPAVASTGAVRVTDLLLATATSALTHIEPVEISSGASHTCVRYNEGSVKCFGDGSYGQLGHGASTDIADASAELGGNLPFVSLGSGRSATAIATGADHSCALLDNATMKCWGQNSYGQLGIGSVSHKGDGSGEMGDNLAAINLGSGRTAIKIFAFGYQSCAILDNGITKCFGRNLSGQLGQDDTMNRGTVSAQMGDTLPAIQLGAGRTAVKISGGFDFACALLDNASVKCFGGNNFGQLGAENTDNRGDSAGEMAALSEINFGGGRTVTELATGKNHACVILDNGTIKCWGQNSQGELGHGHTANWGGSANQMADNLPVSALTGFTAVKIFAGNKFTCAQNSGGAVRCWGANAEGQLLIGHVQSQGDSASELAALTNVNLGTGQLSSKLSLGYNHACSVLSTKRIKCWGSAANGNLGNGTTSQNIGDAAGELGDSLAFVNH